MIPEAFWKSWLAIWIVAGPILLSFVSIVYSLYLSRRHLDAMMEALKNSHYIHLWGPSLRNQGWIGSGLLIAKITGMVMMPRTHIRIGELNPTDFENFPTHLKRLLKIDFAILIAAAVWMLIVSVLLEFE